ncbi:helix-turn-helix domain-containing protein [Microbulbifer variabilis]|uniref:helix-turn-helix domain-containing protein n=1 Tax=Microbulbifer variabilis TaxID=266805 RepID=UPI000361E47A|nr:helix-turn-helix transcriptional regulator [Microbulbifer variabilis]
MVYELMQVMQDQDIRQAFGKRLKELRKQKGWPQKELASKLDIRYSHLNKYESGMHAPPLEKLIQLADIFEVSLDYLVMGQPMEESPIRNEVLFKRFKLLETFDDQDKDTVIRVIDAIIAQRQVEHAMRPLER